MYTNKTQIYVYQGAKVLGIMEEAKFLYIRKGSLFCSPTSCNNRTIFASLDVTGACWDKFVPVGYVVLHFVTELTRSITICFTSICWTYGLDLYYSTTGKYVYIHHTYIHTYINTYMFVVVNFESKGDKLSSSAECRIRTHQGLRHQIVSRLNARWQTDWAIEDQA